MTDATIKNVVREVLKEVIAENALDHGSLNLPLGSRARGGSIDSQIDKYKADEAAAKKQKAKDDAAATKTAKTEAREYERYISIMVDKVAAKQGANFNKREATATLDSMMKWQPEKFVMLMKKFKSENGL